MDGSLLEPTLYTIKGMAILDNDGNRILAKYYDPNIFPTSKEQRTFEKNLFSKTHRANAEIIMLDGLTCVYRSNVDLFFYVMGSSYENELILMSVLQCLYDSVNQILRKNVEKRVVLENLDTVMLAMDEICDGGIILEADSVAVVQRVALRTDDIPLGEQTVAQIWYRGAEPCNGRCCWMRGGQLDPAWYHDMCFHGGVVLGVLVGQSSSTMEIHHLCHKIKGVPVCKRATQMVTIEVMLTGKKLFVPLFLLYCVCNVCFIIILRDLKGEFNDVKKYPFKIKS